MFDCDLEDATIGAKWNEWIKGLDNYLKWVNVTDGERRKAALLHHAGIEIMRIYEALEKNGKSDDSETEDTYEDMKNKLANHFNPKKNRFYENHVFRTAKQEDGESLASFTAAILTHYLHRHTVNKCNPAFRIRTYIKPIQLA